MTSFNTFLKQGLLCPKRFLEGRLQKSTTFKKDLKIGEGAIIDVDGKKVAAYRKNNEELITLSPVCTHMGCIVGWNKSEKTCRASGRT
ncbi:MAG: Rieske 2Fe-2S domain-containing protein [Candidatus Levybacteria bacterium]|nr:Rieske 2Fe-2S domain-containing protein [Candidatus Levybacteria bacterium]